jgi:2-hydroxychromene-2-carboxylate isomerase
MATIKVTYFNDPACPWGYCASPALAVLRWRYGEQLRWQPVMIGLSESAERYAKLGYTPTRAALGYLRFRRYGMPFSTTPRSRMAATAPACRAVVATRLLASDREHAAFRALQFAWFTTELVLDNAHDIEAALAGVSGLDAPAVVASLDDPRVIETYESDRELAYTAAGGPTEFQGKAANSHGRVRYTAPSLIFESEDGRRLEGGGFQTIEAYDVLIANLDANLERQGPPDGAREALELLPDGLVTQEVAAILAHNNQAPDRLAAERELVELAGSGAARRVPLGDDALWLPT